MDSSFSTSARRHGMDPKRRRSGAEQEQPGSSTLRCAIYTRKSTEEGLTREFNTLEAQRESAEAFVQSQLHAGWTALAERYDDGGYTGANLERPALRRLLDDVEAGRVDCVLVYKVDRLSRSLLDFARLMDRFDRRSVSFVSVTQQFNTTSSLGRLTLNILLSFAHYAECAIMRSESTRVAVWRVLQRRDAPHNTSSRNEVISLLDSSDCLALLAQSRL